MEKNFRSSCPISSALDVIGDKWSLLIIRDMLLGGKKTFKEISNSEEGIATNILSSRLKLFEKYKLITKRKLPENKKENIYFFTEKAISLTPMIVELILWSDQNIREYNSNMFSIEEKGFNNDKEMLINHLQQNYKNIVQQTIG
jgi:DNA-binding HxlR family transcriptional regulator